jgi:hypothetical protein
MACTRDAGDVHRHVLAIQGRAMRGSSGTTTPSKRHSSCSLESVRRFVSAACRTCRSGRTQAVDDPLRYSGAQASIYAAGCG